jgi:hypothetical protein
MTDAFIMNADRVSADRYVLTESELMDCRSTVYEDSHDSQYVSRSV